MTKSLWVHISCKKLLKTSNQHVVRKNVSMVALQQETEALNVVKKVVAQKVLQHYQKNTNLLS